MSPSELEKRLREQGLEAHAVQRVLDKKARLNLPEDDAIVELFIEFEWYLKAYQSIPEAIAQANDSAVHAAQARSEAAVHEVLKGMRRELSTHAAELTQSVVRTQQLSALLWAWTALMFVAAASMAFVAYLQGRLPSYFPPHLIQDNVFLTFLVGSLNAPTYQTVGVVWLCYGVFVLVQRVRRGRQRRPWRES